MMTLRNLASFRPDQGHSQFEESAMIDACLDVLGIAPSYVVEFGAGDGPDLSNTWHLAEAGARALYIEADYEKHERLVEAAKSLFAVAALRAEVHEIDPYLTGKPDVMSIDVDGEDYAILEAMEARPRVLVIEHHPMIPPWCSHVGGPDVGASALAIVDLAHSKGFRLVGMTHCNCIFVRAADRPRFDHLNTSLEGCFDPSAVTFAVSNVKSGDYKMIGNWAFGRGEELP